MTLTRRIFSSSVQLILANGLARALGIVSLPLLTHWLAPAAYGQAALAGTLMSLVSVIGLMGMDMSYARSYLSRTPPNGEAVETFLWRLAVGAALAAGAVAAVLWLVHACLDGNARSDVAILAFFGTACSLLLAMAQTRSRLHNRHRRLAVAVATGGVSATVIALFLSGGRVADERALVVGYVLGYLVPLAIMGIPGWRQLAKSPGLSAAARRSVFRVGLPGVITAPMYWVLSSADRWFLQASADSSAVGVYAVACTFGQLGMMVNSALVAIWLPEATRVHEANDRTEGDRQLGLLFTRLLAVMIVVWLGVSITGGDLLRWLTNERFHVGADLVPWLASAVLFYGIYHLANTGLYLERKLKWSALTWAGSGSLSLILNALLVPRFGVMAAAAAQSTTFALLAMVVWRLSQRVHPLFLPKRRITCVSVLSLISVAIGCRLPAVTDVNTAFMKLAFLLAVTVAVLFLMEPRELPNALRRIGVIG